MKIPLKIIAILIFCAGATRSSAEDLPKAIARFQFDGENENDSTGNKGNKLIMHNYAYPTFRGNALYGNGDYEGSPVENPAIKTASLDFKAFTIALRFKAMSFKNRNNNILSGGRYSRWISFCIGSNISNPSENLTVSFNNQEWQYEYPVKLEVDRWYSLVCGVNLQSRTVTTYLDGYLLPSIKLPRDFRLRVLEGDKGLVRQAREKSWHLANYATRQVFHGLFDELAVFDGDVASKVANDYYVDPLLVEILRHRLGEARPGLLLDEAGTENDSERQGIGQIERRLRAGGIQATAEGIINYLGGDDPDAVIARLIQQLGNDDFFMREGAEGRLRSFGFQAQGALQAAASSEDADIAYRSRRLLDQIGAPLRSKPLILSAMDYLRARPSANAVPSLFATITGWRSSEEFARICAALLSCARPEHRDLIRKSLASENPRVRFAAVVASGRVFEPTMKEQVLGTLLSDEDELVRLAAASALLPGRKVEAAEVLQALGESSSFTVRYLLSSQSQEL